MQKVRTGFGLLLAVVLVPCGCGRDAPDSRPGNALEVVATTSILECAVRDVGGEDFRVCRLVPPHSCPGHFDLTPADLRRITRAPLFIRHDYQSYLHAKLSRAGKRPRRGVAIPSRGAQTIPANYLAVCRKVCDALSELTPDKAPALETRLAQTAERVRKAEADVIAQARGLKGRIVLASHLQADFCRWMGLVVAATFDDADQASLKGVEQAVEQARQAKASAVVCNLQRGLREGRALAERLGLPLVVLSNFPEAGPDRGGYLGLLRRNVQALVRGLPSE